MGCLDRFFGVSLPGVLVKRAGLVVVLTVAMLVAAAVSIGLVAAVDYAPPRFFRRDHNLGLVYRGGRDVARGGRRRQNEYGSATQLGTGGYDETQWSPQCSAMPGYGKCAHTTGFCQCYGGYMGLRCESHDEEYTEPPVTSPPTTTPTRLGDGGYDDRTTVDSARPLLVQLEPRRQTARASTDYSGNFASITLDVDPAKLEEVRTPCRPSRARRTPSMRTSRGSVLLTTVTAKDADTRVRGARQQPHGRPRPVNT